MSSADEATKGGWLDLVERIGNKLPDPVTLFIIGAALVMICSELAVLADVQVRRPAAGGESQATAGDAAEADDEANIVCPVSLLRQDGLKWVWLNLVGNFTSFAPLGVVLVGMLGIGVAERTGLLGAILKSMVLLTPGAFLTPAVVFVGVMSSMALDAGYIVLPPLAAAVFMRSGRSPVVGLAAVFAGVAAGFSANLLITGLDPLLQGFTQTAINIVDKNYVVDIRCNYYFMIASTILITLVGWAVTKWIVEPRFSKKDIQDQITAFESDSDEAGEAKKEEAEQHETVTPLERKGLAVAGIALFIALGIIVAMTVMESGSLYGLDGPEGRQFAVWVKAIVPILFVLFLVPGLAYGIAVGTIRSDRELASMMSKTMAGMGSYIVLAFFAAQFVSWFGHSNLGLIMAVKGVQLLQQADLNPMVLVIAIVFLCAVINLFIGSASAKWGLISPVFVPIFAGVGISPELTQAAYRVGDSVTNSITPLNPYMVIMLVFLQRYIPRAGLGTLISVMLPYTLAFLCCWITMLVVWMVLGLPLGPGDTKMFIEPVLLESAQTP